MRRLFSVLVGTFLILSLSNLSHAAEQMTARYYVLPEHNLSFLQVVPQANVIAQLGGFALVKMSPNQVQALSQKMHGTFSICGGFTDIQAQMEMHNWSPMQALQWVVRRPAVLRRFDIVAPSYPSQVETVLSKLSQGRVGSLLAELAAMPDRYAAGENGVKAAEWLANRAASLAQSHQRKDIGIRMIETGRSYKQSSVLVRVPGLDSSLPSVVVGGHMDTYNNGKPGADDDGTGTASVMEIYNSVLDSGIKFKRDLYFVFYAAEEWGLFGSQRVAAEFKAHNIPVRGVLQFDMTGFKSPEDPKEIYFINDHVDLNLTSFLKQLTVAYVKIPAGMIGDTKCGYACSDHASWTDLGYSSGFPFEASMENYNKALHTSRDTIDLLNPIHAMNYVKLGAAFAVESAEPAN